MNRMSKFIDSVTQKILNLILPTTAFLIPLFFLPLTLDFFAPHKRILLVTLASTALLAWILRIVSQKKFHFTLTPASIPLIIVAVIFVISSFMQAPNVRQAFVGETATLLALTIIFITTTSTIKNSKFIKLTFNSLLASTSLVSIVAIAQFVQLGKLTGISWLGSPLFNPAGGPVNFMAVSVPLLVAVIAYIIKTKRANFFHILVVLLLFIASTTSGVSIYMNKLQFMPFTAAWVVAIGTLQNPVAALLGSGPNTYQNIYANLKPASVNTDQLWNINFMTSANLYLHLLTTTGLIAMLAYAFAGIKSTLAGFKKSDHNEHIVAYSVLLFVSLIVQLLLPPSIVMLTVSFLAMALIGLELKIGTKKPKSQSDLMSKFGLNMTSTEYKVEHTSEKYDLLFWFFGVLAVLLLAYNNFLIGKAYASEFVYTASIRAAAANDGAAVYNLQNRAISLKPYDSAYRISYSRTNIAIAASLSSAEDVSEDVQADIAQLVQQAIREAKIAAQLEPNSSIAWQNLATIYQQLIGTAEGADGWTVEAYGQAIALDPSNPQLRLAFGSVFYSAKNYDQAINYFTQAVRLKPDWANAYYNLAVAYRDAKQPALALQAMRVVVELLDPTNPDYQKAQDELETFREAAAQAKAEQEAQAAAKQEQGAEDQFITPKGEEGSNEAERLTPPEQEPTPLSQEELVLPEESAPEI